MRCGNYQHGTRNPYNSPRCDTCTVTHKNAVVRRPRENGTTFDTINEASMSRFLQLTNNLNRELQGFYVGIFTCLIMLKITGWLSWSWWLVTATLWVPYVISIVLIALVFILALMMSLERGR